MGKKGYKPKPQTTEEKVGYYYDKYKLYYRAIAVLWAVLVICFLIITIVCLIQPTWLGAERDAPGTGYFGLWRYFVLSPSGEFVQTGTFLDFGPIPSGEFQAATLFVFLTVLLNVICVLCFFLFICLSAKLVFIICGILLSINVLLLFLACVIYPGGWSADAVRTICRSDYYDSGDCSIQWAYILAIVAIFDGIVLAVLAFVLAFRTVKLLPWQEVSPHGSKAYIVHDEAPVQYVETVRRQPVVLVDDRSAPVVHTGTLRSHKSSKHNFQL